MAIAAEESEEVITWIQYDWAPIHVVEGARAGEGIMDQVTRMLIADLPDYQHRFVVANAARTRHLLRSGENICHASARKIPEREQSAYFSLPTAVGPPLSMIIRADQLEEIAGHGNNVSLESLLTARPNFRIGINKGRSYGDTLDTLFARYAAKASITIFAASDLTGMLRMVNSNRLDAVIAYPVVTSYLAEAANIDGAFATLLIDEVKDHWPRGYIRCTKNEWGRKVIQRINQTLLRIRPTQEFNRVLTQWLPPELKQPLQVEQDRMLSESQAPEPGY